MVVRSNYWGSHWYTPLSLLSTCVKWSSLLSSCTLQWLALVLPPGHTELQSISVAVVQIVVQSKEQLRNQLQLHAAGSSSQCSDKGARGSCRGCDLSLLTCPYWALHHHQGSGRLAAWDSSWLPGQHLLSTCLHMAAVVAAENADAFCCVTFLIFKIDIPSLLGLFKQWWKFGASHAG